MLIDRVMPTYEYSCPTCGTFDAEQRITAPALDACPSCGAKVERLISRTNFALKGAGWAKDGYQATGAKPAGGCGEKGACGTSACPAAQA
jgi:putative FmdB family regulatory protein